MLVASHDSVLLKNTNNCAKELGNDLVVRSLVALENFPFDIFVGQSGIAGDLKKYTDIILDTPTLSVQYSGRENCLIDNKLIIQILTVSMAIVIRKIFCTRFFFPLLQNISFFPVRQSI